MICSKNHAEGVPSVAEFFQPRSKKKRGARKKRFPKGKHPKKAAAEAPVEQACAPAEHAPATAKAVKLGRMNWSLPKNVALSEQLKRDWLNKEGCYQGSRFHFKPPVDISFYGNYFLFWTSGSGLFSDAHPRDTQVPRHPKS